MEQLIEQSNLDIYDEIISMRKEMLKEIFKEKYNLYMIDDNIDEIVENIFKLNINFNDIDPNYKKETPKMIREKGRLRPNRCLSRKINGGYGGQCCKYKLPGTDFCKKHQLEENRWCGLITEDRQEVCYLINDKGIHPHRWKN